MVDSLPTLKDEVVVYDSEFVRNHTYYPNFMLMQLYQASWETVQILDMKQNPQSIDVWKAWLQHDKPFLMHAGYNDLWLILRASGGLLPRYFLDSQVGFAFCQPIDTPGYATMIKAFLGIDLDKSIARSNWEKRPLAPEQLAYAASDVWYLTAAYEILCDKLRALGRMEWWQEDSQAVCQTLLQCQAESAYDWYNLPDALNSIGHLPRARYIAQVLVKVRDELARNCNRTHEMILSNFNIMRAAKWQPRSFEEFIKLLPPCSRIWEAHDTLQRAFSKRNLTYASNPKNQASPQLRLVDQGYLLYLKGHIDKIARELNISPNTLISKRALIQWCTDPDKAIVRLDSGFRKALFERII